MKSSAFTLTLKDWTRGFLLAAMTAFLTGISASIYSGALPTLLQLKVAGVAGLAAGISYIIKNFLTNDVGVAQKTIEKAGGTVTENYNPPNPKP